MLLGVEWILNVGESGLSVKKKRCKQKRGRGAGGGERERVVGQIGTERKNCSSWIAGGKSGKTSWIETGVHPYRDTRYAKNARGQKVNRFRKSSKQVKRKKLG